MALAVMSIFDLINNQWAVGIGGGVLSGLAVTGITRLFLEKKDDRDLLERATAANKELIYAIRPCIAEGVIPITGVVESLVASTARKYRLSANKLSTPRQLMDDLIKEVMDSSFISASTKADYCAKLNKIFIAPELEDGETAFFSDADPVHMVKVSVQNQARDVDRELRYKESRQKLLSMTSIMMGLMTALMTASFALLDFVKDKSVSPSVFTLVEPLKILLPVVATMGAMVVAVVAMRISTRVSSFKMERRQRDEEDVLSNSQDRAN